MVLGIAFAVVVVFLASALFGWSAHIHEKNEQIWYMKEDLEESKSQLDRLLNERVPLRTVCRCKHDAVFHDDYGCHKEGFFLACDCQATQEQVLYDPEPMRKMLPL